MVEEFLWRQVESHRVDHLKTEESLDLGPGGGATRHKEDVEPERRIVWGCHCPSRRRRRPPGPRGPARQVGAPRSGWGRWRSGWGSTASASAPPAGQRHYGNLSAHLKKKKRIFISSAYFTLQPDEEGDAGQGFDSQRVAQ